jgi:hypothetical protein
MTDLRDVFEEAQKSPASEGPTTPEMRGTDGGWSSSTKKKKLEHSPQEERSHSLGPISDEDQSQTETPPTPVVHEVHDEDEEIPMEISNVQSREDQMDEPMVETRHGQPTRKEEETKEHERPTSGAARGVESDPSQRPQPKEKPTNLALPPRKSQHTSESVVAPPPVEPMPQIADDEFSRTKVEEEKDKEQEDFYDSILDVANESSSHHPAYEDGPVPMDAYFDEDDDCDVEVSEDEEDVEYYDEEDRDEDVKFSSRVFEQPAPQSTDNVEDRMKETGAQDDHDDHSQPRESSQSVDDSQERGKEATRKEEEEDKHDELPVECAPTKGHAETATKPEETRHLDEEEDHVPGSKHPESGESSPEDEDTNIKEQESGEGRQESGDVVVGSPLPLRLGIGTHVVSSHYSQEEEEEGEEEEKEEEEKEEEEGEEGDDRKVESTSHPFSVTEPTTQAERDGSSLSCATKPVREFDFDHDDDITIDAWWHEEDLEGDKDISSKHEESQPAATLPSVHQIDGLALEPAMSPTEGSSAHFKRKGSDPGARHSEGRESPTLKGRRRRSTKGRRPPEPAPSFEESRMYRSAMQLADDSVSDDTLRILHMAKENEEESKRAVSSEDESLRDEEMDANMHADQQKDEHYEEGQGQRRERGDASQWMRSDDKEDVDVKDGMRLDKDATEREEEDHKARHDDIVREEKGVDDERDDEEGCFEHDVATDADVKFDDEEDRPDSLESHETNPSHFVIHPRVTSPELQQRHFASGSPEVASISFRGTRLSMSPGNVSLDGVADVSAWTPPEHALELGGRSHGRSSHRKPVPPFVSPTFDVDMDDFGKTFEGRRHEEDDKEGTDDDDDEVKEDTFDRLRSPKTPGGQKGAHSLRRRVGGDHDIVANSPAHIMSKDILASSHKKPSSCGSRRVIIGEQTSKEAGDEDGELRAVSASELGDLLESTPNSDGMGSFHTESSDTKIPKELEEISPEVLASLSVDQYVAETEEVSALRSLCMGYHHLMSDIFSFLNESASPEKWSPQHLRKQKEDGADDADDMHAGRDHHPHHHGVSSQRPHAHDHDLSALASIMSREPSVSPRHPHSTVSPVRQDMKTLLEDSKASMSPAERPRDRHDGSSPSSIDMAGPKSRERLSMAASAKERQRPVRTKSAMDATGRLEELLRTASSEIVASRPSRGASRPLPSYRSLNFSSQTPGAFRRRTHRKTWKV